MTEVEKRIFGGDFMHKMGCQSYHFAENPAYFVLKIELLLTVLSNLEREAALKDSTF